MTDREHVALADAELRGEVPSRRDFDAVIARGTGAQLDRLRDRILGYLPR